MGSTAQGGSVRAGGYFPLVMLATLAVTVLPGLAAGALQAAGVVDSWIVSAGIATMLSMTTAAAGSGWWARRAASRDIVFADLMLWGWVRRLRTERRLESARWLLGCAADLDPARQATLLERLSAALEARDAYTHGHSRRVTRHSHRIARQMGLPPEHAARVRTAAAVHDVGKIETPREVLNKPGRLTDGEFAAIKRHPLDGATMVAALGDDELTAIVRHHHERLDGRGYPDGLRGGEIPLGARIVAVADTFDALTSNRPYRLGSRHEKALDILRQEAGRQLDPDAVAAFLSYYSGRRALPWWSMAAAAPSRLATWVLSGVGSATTGPFAGGTAALGAAFVVGATLTGAPARGEDTRAAGDTAAVVAKAGGGPGDERQAGEPAGGGGDQGASGEGNVDRRGPGNRDSAGGNGDPAGAHRDARRVSLRGDAGASGGAPGSGDRPSGADESGAGSGDVAAEGAGERDQGGSAASDGGSGGGSEGSSGQPLPDVRVPDVQVPDARLSDVQVPDVRVPDVRVPDVRAPDVGVPDVRVPEVPDVSEVPAVPNPPALPPIQPRLEAIGRKLPLG